MPFSSILRRLTLLLAPWLMIQPLQAWAHTGDGAFHTHPPFLAGLLHPLSGIDHLMAMVALGVWSALALRRVWLAPGAFIGVFALGALAGVAGMAVPWVEPMIAASLLVLGLLVATRRAVPPAVAIGVSAFFAFFHGAAHGQELGPLAASGLAAALAGMLMGTLALHVAGILGARHVLAARHRLTAAAGAVVALTGSSLLLGLA